MEKIQLKYQIKLFLLPKDNILKKTSLLNLVAKEIVAKFHFFRWNN